MVKFEAVGIDGSVSVAFQKNISYVRAVLTVLHDISVLIFISVAELAGNGFPAIPGDSGMNVFSEETDPKVHSLKSFSTNAEIVLLSILISVGTVTQGSMCVSLRSKRNDDGSVIPPNKLYSKITFAVKFAEAGIVFIDQYILDAIVTIPDGNEPPGDFAKRATPVIDV